MGAGVEAGAESEAGAEPPAGIWTLLLQVRTFVRNNKARYTWQMSGSAMLPSAPPASRGPNTGKNLSPKLDNWPPTTIFWTFIVLLLPAIPALPSAVRGLWFATLGCLVVLPVMFGKTARPLYPAVWITAGYASLTAIVLATNEVTILQNLFVGLQLLLLLGLGPFVMTYNSAADPLFTNRLAGAFLAGQSISGVVALLQVQGFSSFQGPPYAEYHGRALGLSEHPNTLGLLSAVGILVALHIGFLTRKHRLIAFALALVNVLGLISSGSLTGVTAAVVGFTVMLVCARDQVGNRVISGLAFLSILWIAATYSGLVDRLPSISRRYDQVRETTWGARTETYAYAWSRLLDDPIFGNGLNISASETGGGTYNLQVHNALLRAWFQGGMILGLAFVLVTAAIMLLILRSIYDQQSGTAAAVLTAVLIYSLFSPMLEQRTFWLIILVAWASISIQRTSTIGASTERDPPESQSHSSALKTFDASLNQTRNMKLFT
jgi:hypothetical protein